MVLSCGLLCPYHLYTARQDQLPLLKGFISPKPSACAVLFWGSGGKNERRKGRGSHSFWWGCLFWRNWSLWKLYALELCKTAFPLTQFWAVHFFTIVQGVYSRMSRGWAWKVSQTNWDLWCRLIFLSWRNSTLCTWQQCCAHPCACSLLKYWGTEQQQLRCCHIQFLLWFSLCTSRKSSKSFRAVVLTLLGEGCEFEQSLFTRIRIMSHPLLQLTFEIELELPRPVNLRVPYLFIKGDILSQEKGV